MGGHIKNPVYSEVCKGNTGHTETIKVTYDQDLVTFGDLLKIFFLTHDPTTPNRQGNDVGSQYKSAIFFNNFEEKIQIENCIKSLQIEGTYDNPIITEVNSKCPFYEAEVVHHNYYNQNKKTVTFYYNLIIDFLFFDLFYLSSLYSLHILKHLMTLSTGLRELYYRFQSNYFH